MHPRQRRLIVGASVVLLAIVVIFPWIRQVAARPAIADFAPTRTPDEAAARVAAAQKRQTQQRHDALQRTTTSGELPLVPTVFFPQTGHHLSNRAGFLDFWRANGQALIFGYPITEEIVEDDQVVQYFERARFEYHAAEAGEAGEIRLGLLGREMQGEADSAGVPDPQNGSRYFPETRHTLSGEFLTYWKRRGGLPIFGYPISEKVEENGRIVQYFERARFEYHPEDMKSFYRQVEQANGISLHTLHEVVLSDVGRQAADARSLRTAPADKLTGVAEWSPTLWQRRIEVNLSSQRLIAYEDDLVVYRAPVATGRNGFTTPTGSFAVYDKLRLQTMSGDAGGESWYVPNVPWVMYVVGGVALHGTYWHDKFGSGYRLSHGCINLGMDDAEWLYSWADVGTPVEIYY
ncbi:MAG TPA: L,D-transpeptidase [Roseiflexaceae bacterium]|nr:L,D-transpeptidase [Roseiflexaceae bacterium]